MNTKMRDAAALIAILGCILVPRESWAGPKDSKSRITAALHEQRRLQLDLPISEVEFLSAHNAWNDGRNTWNNQRMKLTDLLDSGIRMVDFDWHWHKGKIQLCHDKCGAIYGARDDAGKELAKVRDWLERNSQEFVVIDLEDRVHDQDEVHGLLLQHFPQEIIFRPGDMTGGAWPSLRQLRAMGKRLMIKSANATYDGSLIWDGEIFATGASPNYNSVNVKDIDTALCTVNDMPVRAGSIYAALDSKLGKDLLPDAWVDKTGTINERNIHALLACGVTIINADRWSDKMLKSALWSRSETADLAHPCWTLSAQGHWTAASCHERHPFLCAGQDARTWHISKAQGTQHEGTAICAAEFPGSTPKAPRTAREQSTIRQMQGQASLWLDVRSVLEASSH